MKSTLADIAFTLVLAGAMILGLVMAGVIVREVIRLALAHPEAAAALLLLIVVGAGSAAQRRYT